MATWVVGDVQGCRKPLKRLLRRVGFSWSRDRLWSCGDLVNRGPRCLKTLRWFFRHRDNIQIVLGNHDLHLLAVAAGARAIGRKDTIGEIIEAPDSGELLTWLRNQPLIHHERDVTMVHAGIPPQWSIAEALLRAREVEEVLRSDSACELLKNMYGNEPAGWSDDLTGMERLRLITNYFTRMRYCHADGRLDLISKGPLDDPGGPAAEDRALDAWFNHPQRKARDDTIIFGHWASLRGRTSTATAIGLDSGCVWGNSMTLYCVETGERVEESCSCGGT